MVFTIKVNDRSHSVDVDGDTYHFHGAKSGDYVTQLTAIGPLSIE